MSKPLDSQPIYIKPIFAKLFGTLVMTGMVAYCPLFVLHHLRLIRILTLGCSEIRTVR